MLDQILKAFDVSPDEDLDVMTEAQSLEGLTARALTKTPAVLETQQPELVIVQGDTTTAFVAALADFYKKIPVGHVEAELRTHDRYAPFPEEINRRIIGSIADLHFAATGGARDNLLAEGVRSADIFATGNTVIDALLTVRDRLRETEAHFTDRNRRRLHGPPEGRGEESIGSGRLSGAPESERCGSCPSSRSWSASCTMRPDTRASRRLSILMGTAKRVGASSKR